jgi:hypothetical protein
MTSYFVRTLALLLSIFLFWLASREPAGAIIFIIGGWFFLTLFIAAFFARKYLELCVGILFLFPVWIGWATGMVIRLSRYGTNKFLSEDPVGYWVQMGIWLCMAIGVTSYGVYQAFFKKSPNPSLQRTRQTTARR